MAESNNQSASGAREEPAAAGSQSVSLSAGNMAKRQEERASTPSTRHRLRADETCHKTETAEASLADRRQNRSEQYLGGKEASTVERAADRVFLLAVY